MFWKRLNDELPEMAEAIRQILRAQDSFKKSMHALEGVYEMVLAALPYMPLGMKELWETEELIIKAADPTKMSREMRCSLCPMGELGIKKYCPDALGITDLEGTALGDLLMKAKQGGLPC